MRSLAWLVAIAAAVGLAASSCSVEEKPPVGKTSEVKPPAVPASEEKTPEVKAPGEKPFEVKSFLDIGTLGGVTGWAFDVNDCCVVTGWALNAAEQVRPFLWQEGKMTELPVPPDSGNVQAWRINNAGIICGQSNPGIGRHRALVGRGAVRLEDAEGSGLRGCRRRLGHHDHDGARRRGGEG